MYYIYILKSKKDDKLYIGSTNDLRRRLSEHNEGKVSSTKSRVPFELKLGTPPRKLSTLPTVDIIGVRVYF